MFHVSSFSRDGRFKAIFFAAIIIFIAKKI